MWDESGMRECESALVMGVRAGPVRLTVLGAALLALAVAVPGGMVLLLAEAIWRWLV